MNKKIKGHELMKLIAENKIKEGQEFVLTIKNTLTKKRIYWSGKNLIYCDTGKFVFGDNADIYFLLGDIEILEDKEKTDIKMFEQEWFEQHRLVINEVECDLALKTNEIIDYLLKLNKRIDKED